MYQRGDLLERPCALINDWAALRPSSGEGSLQRAIGSMLWTCPSRTSEACRRWRVAYHAPTLGLWCVLRARLEAFCLDDPSRRSRLHSDHAVINDFPIAGGRTRGRLRCAGQISNPSIAFCEVALSNATRLLRSAGSARGKQQDRPGRPSKTDQWCPPRSRQRWTVHYGTDAWLCYRILAQECWPILAHPPSLNLRSP